MVDKRDEWCSAFWKFGLYFLSATILVEILHKRMLLVEDVLGT